MPRTKIIKKVQKEVKDFSEENAEIDEMFTKITKIYETMKENIRSAEAKHLQAIKMNSQKMKLTLGVPTGSATLGSLRNGSSTMISMCNVTSSTNNVTSTTVNSTAKSRRGRSKSASIDEGYLTAESGKGSSGQKASPVARGPRKSSRISRSLSRSRTKIITSTSKRDRTPLNRKPLPCFGTVTPKIKPNTPQVILRRPKQGEVALSLQGSPLMTSAMVHETTANINIPLADGRLFNIQPQRGLRLSQIPALDPEIRKQLQTLRDNLNKVCSVSSKH